ncbi:Uncharacterised protein [Mycobacterium tuberculosis]|nr:hypothetical protein FF22_02122 [Mycobacterium tuberculosis]CFB96178.1 Uncharacterised protein [Mycobacterium tuberculosis]CFR43265.1 Uncharacterised protein [Mycobacterium tuberculosis]CFR96262.1 Uncharacterised protein [Mycobacterium tuberculosis]CFS21053.1 Uncharacterised protein [Mycobacterium tuberculosis]
MGVPGEPSAGGIRCAGRSAGTGGEPGRRTSACARRARRGAAGFRAGPFDAGIDQGPGLGLGQPADQRVIAGRGGRDGWVCDELTTPPGTDGRAHAVAHPVVRGRHRADRRGQRRLLRLSADARAVPQLRLGLHAAGGWHGRRPRRAGRRRRRGGAWPRRRPARLPLHRRHRRVDLGCQPAVVSQGCRVPARFPR